MDLPAVFARYRAEVEAEMKAALECYRSPLYDMLRYHLGWIDEQGRPLSGSSGKALRPTLCLLACEASGGIYQKALPAAAALELLHNYSLIHDDVQDDDRQRRHRPTVWAIWGKPQAINAGSAMWTIANLTMFRLLDLGVPTGKLLRGLQLLDTTCIRLLEGQYLDISFEGRTGLSVAEYLEMVEGKTAALLAGSLEMGAMLATEDERTISALREYGRNLGLAFQIRDDLLGIWGEEAKTGKPVGSDIRRRKKTFPIVYAWEKAGSVARAELERIYGGTTVDDGATEKVLTILAEVGAQAQAQGVIEEYSHRALVALAKITLVPWWRASLEEMVHFLAQRDF